MFECRWVSDTRLSGLFKLSNFLDSSEKWALAPFLSEKSNSLSDYMPVLVS